MPYSQMVESGCKTLEACVQMHTLIVHMTEGETKEGGVP